MKKLLWLIAGLVPSVAYAHPDHGEIFDAHAEPLLHQLTSPIHAIPLVVLAALAVYGLAKYRRAKK